jgi:fumarate reductase subunit D
MKKLLLAIEPVVWLLFGQGILIGTILLTAWVLIVGLARPLGIVDPAALDFERAHALASSLIGRLVLAALCALPLWKGAHHIRALAIDFGGADRDPGVASLLYLIAAAGSAAAILAVIRL